MTLTKKEYDAVLERAARTRPVYRTVGRILRVLLWPITRIGFVRRAMGRSVGGRFGRLFACQRRGEHDKAAALALEALKHYRQRPAARRGDLMWHYHWWQFMRYAVDNLEQCNDPEKWQEAIALARDGIRPFEGHDVAYTFQAFSRRKYVGGDYAAAVELATIAARADKTWAEPELLLGWYELASGPGDGMVHLSRAVRVDPTILSRVSDDPILRLRPDLIARLKEISTGDDAAGGADPPSVED